MNSTFKVVFNKARGALMVVNEITSSVQAKGTKTVVATAVAAMIAGVAGTAAAVETEEVKYDEITMITKDTTTVDGKTFDGKIFNEGAIFGVKAGVGNAATLKITNSTFTNNVTVGKEAQGPVAWTSTKGDNKLIVDGSTFKANHAERDGGALANFGSLKVTNSVFEGNTAHLAKDKDGNYSSAVTGDPTPIGGGAIALGAVSSTDVGTIENTTFKANRSGTNGGAIGTRLASDADNSQAKLSISASFEANEALQNGGAIYNTFYADQGDVAGEGVKVTGTFTNNKAGQKGGAIYNDGAKDKADNKGGVMTLTKSTFTGNTAKNGGAIYNTGKMTVVETEFKDNEAAEHGGALFQDGGSYTQNGGSFEGNKAVANNGGAIRVQNAATLSLKDVAFVGNTAANGGAVDTFNAGKVTFEDVTFEGNKADGWGGAVRLNGGEDASFIVSKGKNITYTGNKAGVKADDAVNTKYNGNAGDFMYMNGGSVATFEIGRDASLTVEDSIASFGTGNTITKTGDGKLALGALEGFVGDLNVEGGIVEVAGGIGEIDNYIQYKTNAGATEGMAKTGTAVAVAKNAVLKMGDVKVVGDTAFTVAELGTLKLKSVTVDSKTYKDLAVAQGETASADYVTEGNGSIQVFGEKSNAVIEGALTVKADGKFTINEQIADAEAAAQPDGVLKVGALNIESVSKKDGENTIVTNGEVLLKKGTLSVAGDSTNAGVITNEGILDIKGGKFTNTGKIDGASGMLTVATGATLDNSGEVLSNTLAVAGTVDNTGKLGSVEKKVAQIDINNGGKLSTGVSLDGTGSYIVFEKLYLAQGGQLDIKGNNVKVGETEEANALEFALGELNLNGGKVTLGGEALTGQVILSNGVAVNVNAKDYEFGALSLKGQKDENTATALNVGSETTTGGLTLGSLNLADKTGVTIGAGKAATGTASAVDASSLKVTGDLVATGTNTITNGGTLTAGAIKVLGAASADGSTDATLAMTGGVVNVNGTITVAGATYTAPETPATPEAGEGTQTAAADQPQPGTISGLAGLTIEVAELSAGALEVQKLGTVTLNNGNITLGSATVDGKLTVGNALQNKVVSVAVNDALTVKKDATVDLAGSYIKGEGLDQQMINFATTVGSLANAGFANFSDLTVNGAASNEGTLTVNSAAVTGDLTNAKNATITVAGDIGVGGSATNNGTISGAGNIAIGADLTNSGTVGASGALTVGKDLTNNAVGTIAVGNAQNITVAGNLTNYGSVTASGNTTNQAGVITNATLNVGGLTNAGTITVQDLVINGVGENKKAEGALAAGTITVAGNMTTNGNFTNTGVVAVSGALTVGEGTTYESALGKSGTTAATTNVGKDASFNITGVAGNTVKLENTWNLTDGGQITVGGSALTDKSVDIAGTITVDNGSTLDAAHVTFEQSGSGSGSFTIGSGSEVTIGTINMENGTLAVNDKLTVNRLFKDQSGGSVIIGAGAELDLTAEDLHMTVTRPTEGTSGTTTIELGYDNGTLNGVPQDPTKFAGISQNNGSISVIIKTEGKLTFADMLKETGAGDVTTGLQQNFGNWYQAVGATDSPYLGGLVFIDGLEFAEFDKTQVLTAEQAAAIKGLVITGFDGFGVKDVEDLTGSYGNVQVAGTGHDLVASGDLILNGSDNLVTDSEGNLVGVEIVDGFNVVYDGAQSATVGSITGGADTGFRVTDGDLTVDGNVGVSDLVVGENADKLTVNGNVTVGSVTLEGGALHVSGDTTVAGNVSAENAEIIVGKLEVTNGGVIEVVGGSLTASDVTAGAIEVDGTVNAGSINVGAGEATLTGVTTVGSLTAGALTIGSDTLKGTMVTVGSVVGAGSVTADNLTAGSVDIDGKLTSSTNVIVSGGVVEVGSADINGLTAGSLTVTAGDLTSVGEGASIVVTDDVRVTSGSATVVDLTAGSLAVAGTLTGSSITINGADEDGNALIVSGGATVGSITVDSDGDTTIKGNLTATDRVDVADITVEGVASVGTIDAADATFKNGLTVTGTAGDEAEVSVNSLTVTAGNVSAEGKKIEAALGIDVTSGSLTAGTVVAGYEDEAGENVYSDITVGGALNAGTVIGADVSVTGKAEVGTLVADKASFDNGLKVTDSATVAEGVLAVTGDLNGDADSIISAGQITLDGNMTASTVVADDFAVTGEREIQADDLTVGMGSMTGGTLTATNLAVNGVEGSDEEFALSAGTAKLGTVNVAEDGVLSLVDKTIAKIETLDGNGLILVGNDGSEEGTTSSKAELSVTTQKGGYIYVDPAFSGNTMAFADASKLVLTSQEGGIAHAGVGSLAYIGNAANGDAGFAAAGLNDGALVKGKTEAAMYINVAANQQIGGALVLDTIVREYDEDTKGLFTSENTLLVLDGEMFVGRDNALFGEDSKVVIGGDAYITGARAGMSLKMTDGTINGAENIRTDADRILGVTAGNGIITVGVKEDLGVIGNIVAIDAVKSYYTDAYGTEATSTSAKFNESLFASNSQYTEAEAVKAANDVAGVGASAGMASVTMDALAAFNDTVAQRTSILAPNAEGVTVWADVNGGKYEAKRLFNGAGYSSDLYAGVIGVDTTVSCGAKIGAALTFGSGDTDSKNTSAVTSMDSDFVGFSIYTAKQFGAANVAIDLGYMQGSNDVSVKAYDLGKFSADTDAFTLGIRGEVLAQVGSFNLVPHAGLRWTKLSVDSFEAGYKTDIDDMNVFQLPVGVTVSGEFEAAGFTWAPAFDLSFVPAFGDKDADMTLGIAGASKTSAYGVQVIDSNPVQATIGIDATNGAWGFGLNYKLGAGSDGRMNNAFNANVRYTF